MDLGAAAKVDAPKLKACVEKQDEAQVNAGLREGEALQVNGVPAIFINGEQINGAAPVEFVYRAIDEALAGRRRDTAAAGGAAAIGSTARSK